MAVVTSRTNALNTTSDLAQAGVVFNDSTRLLDGGLWSTPNDANNQMAYLGMYTTDIKAVLDDINQDLASPGAVTVNGAAYTLTAQDTAVLQEVQGQLQTLINEAPHSVGNSHAAMEAQDQIHTTQLDILSEINNDPTLAAALNQPFAATTGSMDVPFQNLPTGSDNAAALSAATAQGGTLAQIGSVFNAAADLAVGGLNHSNMAEFTADMQAIATGIGNVLNNPTELAAIENGETAQQAALTTIHLETVLNQVNLQINTFDKEYATNPNVAARATNDNLLDIIDIVQNDANLNTAAGGQGTPTVNSGFGELAGYLSGTITHYQDNQAETNFWSQFIAEGNQVNNALDNIAASTTPVAASDLQGLITEIQNYQKFGSSFAEAVGGTFGARFANELVGGTLEADSTNAVQGLEAILKNGGTVTAAAAAQIQAAGQGFIADAADVSGNNNPLGGGTYVGTSTTVAGATSINGLATASATVPVSGAVNANDMPVGNRGGNGGGHDQDTVASHVDPAHFIDHHWG